MTADTTYQPKVHRRQGGDEFVVASGGSLDIESGGSFKIAGTAVSASAAELNYCDITTLGTWAASKALTLDANGVAVYGTTAAPITSSTASKKMFDIRTANSATSGGSYGFYVAHKVTGIGGSGAAIRGYGFAYAGGAVPTVYGVEATAELHNTASCTVSGEAAGLRAVCSLQQATGGVGSFYGVISEFNCAAAGAATGATDAAFFKAATTGTTANGPVNLITISDAIASSDTTKLITNVSDHAATHAIGINTASGRMWLLATNSWA